MTSQHINSYIKTNHSFNQRLIASGTSFSILDICTFHPLSLSFFIRMFFFSLLVSLSFWWTEDCFIRTNTHVRKNVLTKIKQWNRRCAAIKVSHFDINFNGCIYLPVWNVSVHRHLKNLYHSWKISTHFEWIYFLYSLLLLLLLVLSFRNQI